MGQKVNPIGLRLGVNKTWTSKWYANFREYSDFLLEDIKIRRIIMNLEECKNADIAEVEIVRHPQKVTIFIHTARAGMIIGQKGATIDKISADVQAQLKTKIQIKIKEIRKADVNASLIAQSIGRQLAGRASYKKVMKQAISNAMRGGVQGIKIRLSGRLGGADMTRVEEHKDGRVPLHTLRADIDYATYEAGTTYGKIGVKVWVYNGMNYGVHNEDAGTLVKRAGERGIRGEREEKEESSRRAPSTRRVARKEAGTATRTRTPRGVKTESANATEAVKKEDATE